MCVASWFFQRFKNVFFGRIILLHDLVHDVLASHDSDVIMGPMAYQITSLTIVHSTIYSDANERKKSKLPVTGLCAGNSPVTSEFPTQKVSNAMTSSSSGCQDTYQGWMVSLTYGTKGIWIDTICDPPYEFDLCPHPWPWPRIFKIKFCISRVSVIGLIHLNSLICKLWTAMWEWIYIYTYIYMYIFH